MNHARIVGLLMGIATFYGAATLGKTILVTGGCGYIGSCTAYMLRQRGHKIIIIDRKPQHPAIDKICDVLVAGDIGDTQLLERVFSQHHIDAVMHFAASIEAPLSVTDPLPFYENNLVNSVKLLQAMHAHGVNTIIFSSTASVYGEPKYAPIDEQHPTITINPYGTTKLMFEHVLDDSRAAYGLKYVIFRYFNAAGAWPEIGLGEFRDMETHLIPILLNRAHAGQPIGIFGTDYATPDGTCVRDYIHIRDIAQAHVNALDYIERGGKPDIFNLGTGKGTSVKEVVDTLELICSMPIKRAFQGRRAGDPSTLAADNTKAAQILGWHPQHSSIKEIIETANTYHLARLQVALLGTQMAQNI